MIRKLREEDRDALLEYVAAEPECNLFILGDVENFGLESEQAEVFINETAGGWDSIALRYLTNFVVYSRREDYDAQVLADCIKTMDHKCVNGKGSVMERLAPHFPECDLRRLYLSRCVAAADLPLKVEGAELRKLTPKDAEAVVELFLQVEEFRKDCLGREMENITELRLGLETGGVGYGVFINGTLVSTAQSAAENSRSAMLVGVATLPEWRRKGLAGAVVSALCRDCLGRGMEFLCLFYDNPKAGKIYRKIGFQEIGDYGELSPAGNLPRA